MPLWDVQSPPWADASSFRQVMPEEVLVEHEMPMTFTFRNGSGNLMFAHFCGEAGDRCRFIVVPTNPRIIEGLKAGTLSIFDVLDQTRAWLLDVGVAARVVAAWAVSVATVPSGVLPAYDVMLYPDLDPTKRVRTNRAPAPAPVVLATALAA